jgi:hypothetical protein
MPDVKVPGGATLQIITPEKGILAVRPNSLLKLESLGEGTRPYKLKLNVGGLRVANADKEASKRDIGYVPGAGKDKPQLIARLDTSGRSIGNPCVAGSREQTAIPGFSPA